MDNVVSLGITALDGGQTIFNDLPNNALSVKAKSDLNGITLKTAISEDSCLFGGYLDTYTTASTISEDSCLLGGHLDTYTTASTISEDSCLLGGHLDTYTTASTISEKSCLFAPNPTWDYTYIDTTAGSYTWNQVVKETPVNNQLSVKIRKKIKIRCSL